MCIFAGQNQAEMALQHQKAEAKQDTRVVDLFEARKRRYGAPRLAKELQAEGMSINHKTVAESMRRLGLRARAARRFRWTTDSSRRLGVARNLLDQDFSAQRPNLKWAGEITYLRTTKVWVYLAVVTDLCTRKVIGWASSQRIDALKAAITRRSPPHGVILHNDRGSVYCGWQHRGMIRRHGLIAMD